MAKVVMFVKVLASELRLRFRHRNAIPEFTKWCMTLLVLT